MKHEILHLKDYYPQLGANGCDAALTTYLPDNLSEINREHEKHPCLLICPGGGYEFCSQREQEPIAFYFLPDGINVFVLNTPLRRTDIRHSLGKWQRQWN